MKITAITRYKHGAIYQAMTRLGWSQTELARRVGLSAPLIGLFINMRKRPTAEQAARIEKVLIEAGENVDILAEWPKDFTLAVGFKREVTEEIKQLALDNCREAFQIMAPEEVRTDLAEAARPVIEDVLDTLSSRERQIIRWRFLEEIPLTQMEISKKLGVVVANIGQIEARALRKLRHPMRMRMLRRTELAEVIGVNSDAAAPDHHVDCVGRVIQVGATVEDKHGYLFKVESMDGCYWLAHQKGPKHWRIRDRQSINAYLITSIPGKRVYELTVIDEERSEEKEHENIEVTK